VKKQPFTEEEIAEIEALRHPNAKNAIALSRHVTTRAYFEGVYAAWVKDDSERAFHDFFYNEAWPILLYGKEIAATIKAL